MKTGNQEMIRDLNTRLILEAVIQHDPISRAELSSLLGLTKATVSAIVSDLLAQGLLEEKGSRDTKKGRRPIMLTFAKNSGHILSIDLTGRHITLMTCNLRGQNCHLYQYSNHYSPQGLLSPLKTIIQNVMDTLPPSIHGVIAIVIGVHAAVHQNTITFCPYYDLTKLHLAEELESAFHIPVSIENEANLSALGEKTFFHDVPNMVNISIHTGIGLGVILNHKLYCGVSGAAGEFGHTIVEPQGRLCPCGNRGCVEQYASEPAILEEFSRLSGILSPTADDLVYAYRRQNPAAIQAVEQFIKYLAIAVNNIVAIFDPDVIVINCAFTAYLPDLIPMIEAKLSNNRIRRCPILPSSLQDTAILLGGASAGLGKFLGMEALHLK